MVCHACGLEYEHLFAHVRSHGLVPSEYRAYFGLRVKEPLMSQRALEERQGKFHGDRPAPQQPDLTTEQRRIIIERRERRLQDRGENRYDSNLQAERARMWERDEQYRARMRRTRRKFDPGHECPQCGALVCTWTGRASGISTQRVLCGEPECKKKARREAAAIANRRRYE